MTGIVSKKVLNYSQVPVISKVFPEPFDGRVTLRLIKGQPALRCNVSKNSQRMNQVGDNHFETNLDPIRDPGLGSVRLGFPAKIKKHIRLGFGFGRETEPKPNRNRDPEWGLIDSMDRLFTIYYQPHLHTSYGAWAQASAADTSDDER